MVRRVPVDDEAMELLMDVVPVDSNPFGPAVVDAAIEQATEGPACVKDDVRFRKLPPSGMTTAGGTPYKD